MSFLCHILARTEYVVWFNIKFCQKIPKIMAQIQNHTSGRAVANIKALQKLPSTHRYTNKMVLVSCPFPNWILCLVEYSVLTMNIRKKDANKTPYFCINKANFKILQKFSFSHKDTYNFWFHALAQVKCSVRVFKQIESYISRWVRQSLKHFRYELLHTKIPMKWFWWFGLTQMKFLYGW